MLQDFDWCFFRVLVVKLFKRVQVFFPQVVASLDQRLTMLELMWDMTPELRSKWAKAKSLEKLDRHLKLIDQLLTHVEVELAYRPDSSPLSDHPSILLRIEISRLITRAQDTTVSDLRRLETLKANAGL
jgi:hypothetical protein